MLVREFTVSSPLGLHARPAALFVKEAGNYKSKIVLKYQDKEIAARSILGVLSLGVQAGHSITMTIDGADQEEAMFRMARFFNEELPLM